MAVPQNPYVHMEDVEKAMVEGEVSHQTGRTGTTCVQGGKQPSEVLVRIQYGRSKDGTYKRNTGTQRLLRLS